MTYEPYDPKERQITPVKQAVAWIFCALLIVSIAASDALHGMDKTSHEVAAAEAIGHDCG